MGGARRLGGRGGGGREGISKLTLGRSVKWQRAEREMESRSSVNYWYQHTS